MKAKPAMLTTRDLARHLAVAHSTVARALNNDPRISPTMRARVVKAAQKLGYRRDPKLAALMTHMRLAHQRAFRGTLAWITDYNLADECQKNSHLLFWPHAERRARDLGYHLDCFPAVKTVDAPRLERVLIARGIHGAVFQWMTSEFRLEDWAWDWKNISWVFSGVNPVDTCKLDSVDVDDRTLTLRLFEHLAAKDYRRIGVATNRNHEHIHGYMLCTARNHFALQHPQHPAFEHCLLPDWGPASARTLARWIKRNQVDCVASQVRGMEELLRGIGYPVPKIIGLAYQAVRPEGTNSGMSQCEDKLAIAMIETLVAHIEHGRFGLQEYPRQLLLPGVWHQGRTTR
jgi:LacI family transcriptional regulator